MVWRRNNVLEEVLWRTSLLAGGRQIEVEPVECGYPIVNDRKVSVKGC